jgi:hypothetical protein
LWLIAMRFIARPKLRQILLAWNATNGTAFLDCGYKIRIYAVYGE